MVYELYMVQFQYKFTLNDFIRFAIFLKFFLVDFFSKISRNFRNKKIIKIVSLRFRSMEKKRKKNFF